MDWRTTSSALVALIVIFAIIWSRVPIDWEDDYQALYESLAFDTPLIDNLWDVHLDEETNSLIYVKEECDDGEPPRFLLHLVPADPMDMPPVKRSLPFDNRDFWFGEQGRRLPRDICIVRIGLPYIVSSMSTGQYVGEDDQIANIWSETAVVSQAQAR